MTPRMRERMLTRPARGVFGCGAGGEVLPAGTYSYEARSWADSRAYTVYRHDGTGAFGIVAHVAEKWMAEAIIKAARRTR